MDTLLLHSLFDITLALSLVLAARRPLRRAFGAGPAFTLWLLPPLAAALPWLPSLPASWAMLPALPVLPQRLAAGSAAAAPIVSTPWLRWLWLAGMIGMLLRLLRTYLRLRRQARPLPPAMLEALRPALHGLPPQRLRQHPAGPALLWAPRSLLLLPADFLARHDAAERALVLRHELTHRRRGDAGWNLAAELIVAALWFHPLAWLARPRFRLDQELACDEATLRDAPQDAPGYARTLLHSAGLAPEPALIPWLSEPQLKERLRMIQQHPTGAPRRRLGYAALAAILAGSVFVAQAASQNQPATQNLGFNATQRPRYPAVALTGGEQGIVMLKVQVHADGTVGTVTFEPDQSTTTSADLIAAATDAVHRWHFNPQRKDGKPVEAYARVPITFSLDEPPAGSTKNQDTKTQKSA